MSDYENNCFDTMQQKMRYLAQVAKTNVMGNALTKGADRIDELELLVNHPIVRKVLLAGGLIEPPTSQRIRGSDDNAT